MSTEQRGHQPPGEPGERNRDSELVAACPRNSSPFLSLWLHAHLAPDVLRRGLSISRQRRISEPAKNFLRKLPCAAQRPIASPVVREAKREGGAGRGGEGGGELAGTLEDGSSTVRTESSQYFELLLHFDFAIGPCALGIFSQRGDQVRACLCEFCPSVPTANHGLRV